MHFTSFAKSTVSTMSSSDSGGPVNLVTEFEKSYAALAATLVAEDSLHDRSKETLKQEEEKIQNFMEVAR